MAIAELAPLVDDASYTCDVEGCGKSFPTTIRLGAHRWGAHKVKAEGAKSHRAKAKAAPKAPKAPTEKAPVVKAVPVAKRKPVADLLGPAWAAVGMYAVGQFSVPGAKWMMFTSETAGKTLDDALAGTWVDKLLLQKAAGATSKAKGIGTLLGGLALFIAIDKNPSMIANPMVQAAVRMSVEANFEAMLDARIEAKRRAERIEEKAAQLGIETEVTDEATGRKMAAIDALIADLLSTVTSPQPEPVAA